FDLELAKSESSDNPVYYAQYAHDRICSILRQAKENGYGVDKDANVDVIVNGQALELHKKLGGFPDVVQGAADRRATNLIPNYNQKVDGVYHKVHNPDKVLTDDKEKTRAYLAMIEAVRQTLENALSLI